MYRYVYIIGHLDKVSINSININRMYLFLGGFMGYDIHVCIFLQLFVAFAGAWLGWWLRLGRLLSIPVYGRVLRSRSFVCVSARAIERVGKHAIKPPMPRP